MTTYSEAMNNRIILVEPKQLTISRIAHDFGKSPDRNAPKEAQDNGEVALIRSAGDGMEFENTTESPSGLSKWHPSVIRPKPLATSTPSNSRRREKQLDSSKTTKGGMGQVKKSSFKSQIVEEKISEMSNLELSKQLEELKLRLDALEQAKEKLIEEKMKVSNQLGVQTQVNSELKTLLVASVGEDLEERLEKMSMRHALTERQLTRLQSQLDETREELEIASIQSDVWRSKFLASKVMSDELASWKALTDSRYRESNAALETLLEEHRQLATTIASANRFLLKLSKLTDCYREDESSSGYSSIDLAIMNHSLAKTLTEKMISHEFDLRTSTKASHPPSKCLSLSEELQPTLSLGEKRASKAIDEAKTEDTHADRRKKDFLAHSRISQILATRYPMTCLTCKGCKGPFKTV